MVQAAVLDGLVFDASAFSQDGFAAPKVDVGRDELNLAQARNVATIYRMEVKNGIDPLAHRQHIAAAVPAEQQAKEASSVLFKMAAAT